MVEVVKDRHTGTWSVKGRWKSGNSDPTIFKECTDNTLTVLTFRGPHIFHQKYTIDSKNEVKFPLLSLSTSLFTDYLVSSSSLQCRCETLRLPEGGYCHRVSNQGTFPTTE